MSSGTSYLDCFRGTNLRRTEIAAVAWMIQSESYLSPVTPREALLTLSLSQLPAVPVSSVNQLSFTKKLVCLPPILSLSISACTLSELSVYVPVSTLS